MRTANNLYWKPMFLSGWHVKRKQSVQKFANKFRKLAASFINLHTIVSLRWWEPQSRIKLILSSAASDKTQPELLIQFHCQKIVLFFSLTKDILTRQFVNVDVN